MKKVKLSISNERKKYLKKIRSNKILVLCLQLLILISIFVLWELLAKYQIIDSFFFSSPSRIVNTIKDLFNSGDLFFHIWTTLYEAILGFVIATVLGFVIAVILWWSDTIRKVLPCFPLVDK